MKTKDKGNSKEERDKANSAMWAAVGAIATAIFSALSAIVASYLGYLQVITPAQLQIAQTAEARSASVIATALTITVTQIVEVTPTPGLARQLILAQSTFDDGQDGWSAVSAGAIGVTYAATKGNPSGFITIDDGDGDSYWAAPEKFLGDQSAAYNGVLMFDLKVLNHYTGHEFAASTAVLEGRGITLAFQANYDAEGDWTTYTLLLNEHAGWINQATGQAATRADMISVLALLEELLIRGEFMRGLADSVGLDNVLLIGHP